MNERGEARSEWDIFRDLSRAAKIPFLNSPPVDALDRLFGIFGAALTPEHFATYLLFGITSLGRLMRTEGGLKLGDIEWGKFLRTRLETKEKKIVLAADEFTEAAPAAFDSAPQVSTSFPLVLISGGRRAAAYNSWTHNIPKLMEKLKGNFATLNPQDAKSLGISDGDRVRVISPTGSVEIEAIASPDIRPGVVMIHQFWGHRYESGMKTSRKYPGVNVNLLHDDRVRDRFTGMPVYNGTPCRVERVDSTGRRY